MKNILIFFILILLFSCKTLPESIELEKKTNGRMEFYLKPVLTFFNNGQYYFYYEFIYVYPDDFFLLKPYPDDDIDFKIEKSFFKKDGIEQELKIINEKVKKLSKKSKIYNQLVKLSKSDVEAIIDRKTITFLIFNSKFGTENKELFFNIANIDKIVIGDFVKTIEDYKKSIKKSTKK
ncbi:MAG: hypothetical protein A2Y34_02450 [Spirochaetes bacterium GWC1_27_15]|nr:MAG: hypothetical protein A2Z98_15025 [Spirochaetes bacterium GWB1_27_13]OHD28227.1 MAG: hypothetical protein A2Y34_02450 [Spirochaetes bacterium GWC1_27_15]